MAPKGSTISMRLVAVSKSARGPAIPDMLALPLVELQPSACV